MCELCNRDIETTFHHLIPVTLHKRNWFKKRFDRAYMKSHGLRLCYLCHYAVHHLYNEVTLGREYNTLAKLLASEKVQKHIKWASKQK